jgi:hypothetical protein
VCASFDFAEENEGVNCVIIRLFDLFFDCLLLFCTFILILLRGFVSSFIVTLKE